MSVSIFEPRQILVTDTASAHILSQIAKSGHKHLRLGLKESGCNGYMYTLDYINQPTPDDRAIEVAHTLSIYVLAGDLPMVSGTEVDFVTEGLNSSLKFKNPNAESHCGCGESFSVVAGATES